MIFFLSRALTDVAGLSYGYAVMRGDVNQMVSEGALVIADESLIQRIMGTDQLDTAHFGDELERNYGGSDGGWFYASAGSWVVLWVLLYFTLYHWVTLYREMRAGKKRVTGALL